MKNWWKGTGAANLLPESLRSCFSINSRQLKLSPENKNVLVLGYATIGTSVAKFLNRDLLIPQQNIYIHDTSHDKDITVVDGFPVWKRVMTELTFGLVIGCSGQSSFGVDDSVIVDDGGLLVSCSSGPIEFLRRNFIELADLYEHDDIEILRAEMDGKSMHADIPIRFPHRKLTMLNGAWPINFSGAVNCIPTEYIQPTICMMIRAAVQAVAAMSTPNRGLIELDASFRRELVYDFKCSLGENAQILERLR